MGLPPYVPGSDKGFVRHPVFPLMPPTTLPAYQELVLRWVGGGLWCVGADGQGSGGGAGVPLEEGAPWAVYMHALLTCVLRPNTPAACLQVPAARPQAKGGCASAGGGTWVLHAAAGVEI